MDNREHQSPIQVIRRALDTEIITRGRVVLIGLGGTGMNLARPLATFLASLSSSTADNAIDFVLYDGDNFAIENAYRMDIVDFGNKAEVVRRELLKRPATSTLFIGWVAQDDTRQYVAELVQDGDCVLLTCGQPRHQRPCGPALLQWLAGKRRVDLGRKRRNELGRAGTYGNLEVYVRHDGRNVSAPIESLHPGIAHPAD